MRLCVAIGLCGVFSACASSTTSAKLDDRAAIVTAGPRCAGAACKCRVVDDYGHSAPADEGAVAAGLKRFEFRTGRGLDPVRISVEGRGTFEKNTADAEPTCAYVELPPGKHRVHLHAEAVSPEAGMTPALFIREFGEKQQSWYDTFEFRCGGEDVCGLGNMQEWIAKVQSVARGLHDKCGSVRVEGVKWDALRQSGVKLAELEVDLVLEVYKFRPRFPHGSHDCRGIDPTMKAEQEAADK
ncbi:MAG TPA: hypothetical protein VFF06_18395 [Polyangia bacterium]|nr:hypothetical protein [Polyangia bacterium]